MKPLTIRQQVNRIDKWFKKATIRQLNEGPVWYHFAHDWAESVATRFGRTTEEVAQITAILSAQCDWETNKRNVVEVLTAYREKRAPEGVFATERQLDECIGGVLMGWRIPDNRLKTWRFARLILNPMDDAYAVIDRHAMCVAYDMLEPFPKKITPKRYRDAEKAYIVVADRHDVRPSTVQAVTWLTYKAEVGR